MAFNFMGLLSPIIGMGRDYLEGRRQVKQAELNHKIKLTELKTGAAERRATNGQEADIAWENTSLHQAGWKDEFLLLLFSIPLVMCFVPGMDVYVFAGFEALKGTPDWYQYSILLMVGGTYGSKKVMEFMKTKKGA